MVRPVSDANERSAAAARLVNERQTSRGYASPLYQRRYLASTVRGCFAVII